MIPVPCDSTGSSGMTSIRCLACASPVWRSEPSPVHAGGLLCCAGRRAPWEFKIGSVGMVLEALPTCASFRAQVLGYKRRVGCLLTARDTLPVRQRIYSLMI